MRFITTSLVATLATIGTTAAIFAQSFTLTPEQARKLQQLPPAMQAELLKQMNGQQAAGKGGTVKGNTSTSSSASNPDEERLKLLGSLQIDRTNAGILEARLEAAQQAKPEEKPEPKLTPDGKPVPPPTPAQLELTKIRKEVNQLRLNINLGNWKDAEKYLTSLKPNEAKTAYSRILSQLSSSVTISPRAELAAMGAKPHRQQHYMRPMDILALSNISPTAPNDSTLGKLASMLANSDTPPKEFYDTLKKHTRHFGNKDAKTSLRTARFLMDAGQLDHAKPYLPTEQKALADKHFIALNLIARWNAETYKNNQKPENLKRSWQISLDLVGSKDAPHNQRAEALYRALSLVPNLEGETGKKWLVKTFAEADGEGFEILTTVGILASETRQHPSPNYRFEQIKLQHSAAQALLNTPGIDPKPWREILTLYARNWLHEAAHSQRYDSATTMRPSMSVDAYGNPYYTRSSYANRTLSSSGRSRRVAAIDTGDLLHARPDEKWTSLIDRSVRNEILALSAQLLLKVKEHKLALPLLEKLSAINPDKTKKLIREMISVWAENHNPNQRNRYRSSYYYYSGYNQRAETIPLTRSKQERNLKELAELIRHIRTLKLGETFDEEFSNAFIQCHSQAEVWRVEALQSVFGNLSELSADTTTSLIKRMRGNLANLWPDPKLQAQAKTKRKDKELQAQILKGYDAAKDLCADVLEKHPNSWQLELQQWSLLYEESNYRATLGSHPQHSGNKRRALDGIARVAAAYAATLPLEDSTKESTEAFTTWFYAALGSPDLSALKNHHQPVASEFPLIKKALAALPEKVRERHLSDFANTLNSRLANVGADLKYNFLEKALSVTGKHDRIEQAAKVFEYYQDLVTEIVLDVRIDGNDQVSTDSPFGIFINLRHTLEIERESGGFQRYLINQNNSPYSYNYGRPTEDYRDKFEKAAIAALEEHFEVVSVTYHNSKVQSRTDSELGWSVTPYAYMLLKPKGPEIDSIPPLKIDLDFLDTSGYVVLPISSAAIPIDASGKNAQGTRPHRNLKVTMTLDDRKAVEKQELALEVKTTAHGIIPELSQIIDLDQPGYTVEVAEDNELLIAELDAQTDDGAPVSTREWRLVFKPEGDKLPSEFTFPTLSSKLNLAKKDSLTLQKYDDVDLLTVANTVKLGQSNKAVFKPIYLLFLLPVIGLILWLIFRKKPDSVAEVSAAPELPENINPVTAIAYLKRMHQDGKLDDRVLRDLSEEIQTLEVQAFGPDNSPPSHEELKELTSRWRQRAA